MHDPGKRSQVGTSQSDISDDDARAANLFVNFFRKIKIIFLKSGGL